MKPAIQMTRVMFDNDMVELKIDVSDGTSLFSTQVYVGYPALNEVVSDLSVFQDDMYGGILDVRFGEFGPELGNGAFHARIHFLPPGSLCITCKLQSDFAKFGSKTVASEATLHLKTEPILLEAFISEMKTLKTMKSDRASLEAI